MLFAIFLLWLFVLLGRPQDVFPFLIQLRPALILTFVSLGLTLFMVPKKQLSVMFKTKEARLYGLFYIVMILGIPFAFHRRVAFDYVVLLYLSNMIFFYIFIVQINSIKKLETVMAVILLSSLFYSIFTIMLGTFSRGRFFTYGTMFDPNDIAYVLISLFPLSIYFIVNNVGTAKKALALVNVGSSIIVILLTGSRAGMIGLLTVFAMIMFSKFSVIKNSYKVFFVFAVIVLAVIYSENINIERYLTITNLSEDYNVTAQGGRFDIWERSIELLLANPIIGVGVNCSAMAIGYLREDLGLVARWQPTHNSYLQVALETGLIGGTMFLMMLKNCFIIFRNIKKLKAPFAEQSRIIAMAELVKIGFLGQIVIAFFLTQAYSLFFTLYFALSVVMKLLVNEHSEAVDGNIPLIRNKTYADKLTAS